MLKLNLLLAGSFHVDKVVPTPEGEAAKVKVKLRVNINGIFTVSSASLMEKVEDTSQPMEVESNKDDKVSNGPVDGKEPPTPSKEEPVCISYLTYRLHISLHYTKLS